MRNLIPIYAVAFSALTLSASTALAGSVASCRTEAAQAADEWTRGNMTAANDAAAEVTSPVLIVTAGRKYVTSSTLVDPETLRPHLLGNLATQRNQVYAEELDRCLGNLTMKIVSKNPLLLKQLQQKHSDHK